MDYSDSHIDKGSVYDRNIECEPFDNYMARLERDVLDCCITRLFPDGIPRYMDFACGTGRVTENIAPFASESVGVDISDSMVVEAKKKCPNTEFIVGDYTNQALEIEPVNLATTFRFLGNAENELRRKALLAINRSLVLGGYLICNNHRNPNALSFLFHRLTGGERDMDLSHNHLKQLLDEAGFEISETHCIGLWVFRHGFHKDSVLNSKIGALLESYFRFPGCAQVSPDVVVVAKKKRDI